MASRESKMEITFSGLKISSNGNEQRLRDIYYIYFLLRQKLVRDVIPPIMHHAEFFKRHTSSSGHTKFPLVVTEQSAPRTCFITPSIRSSTRSQFPVRKVAFLIQSCDQGWADNPNGGIWTWFTAGVMVNTAGNDPSDRKPSGESGATDRFLDRERQIMRNEVACSVFKTRVVEWTIESADGEERKWISSLQNGDRIAVRAWAQYDGRQNKVRSVSVVISTVVIV